MITRQTNNFARVIITSIWPTDITFTTEGIKMNRNNLLWKTLILLSNSCLVFNRTPCTVPVFRHHLRWPSAVIRSIDLVFIDQNSHFRASRAFFIDFILTYPPDFLCITISSYKLRSHIRLTDTITYSQTDDLPSNDEFRRAVFTGLTGTNFRSYIRWYKLALLSSPSLLFTCPGAFDIQIVLTDSHWWFPVLLKW